MLMLSCPGTSNLFIFPSEYCSMKILTSGAGEMMHGGAEFSSQHPAPSISTSSPLPVSPSPGYLIPLLASEDTAHMVLPAYTHTHTFVSPHTHILSRL